MPKLKKCPFNNFANCIGSECAFYLESINDGKSTFANIDLIIDPADISFPCSLTIVGQVAFLANKPKSKKATEYPWYCRSIFISLTHNSPFIWEIRCF